MSAKKSGGKSTAVAARREMSLTVSPKAKFQTIVKSLEKEFTRARCPGCRSGIDRIVFEDPVVKNVK